MKVIEAHDEGCTGSIPGDGSSSVRAGPSRVRRLIGIQSNIAEKLFTNETPLSGNVPLLHQEGQDWARMPNISDSAHGHFAQDIDFKQKLSCPVLMREWNFWCKRLNNISDI